MDETDFIVYANGKKYNLLTPEGMKAHFKEVALPILAKLKLSFEENGTTK